MPRRIYSTWLPLAAKIQERNKILNAHCVMLQEKLTKAGLKFCILKGQGLNGYYPTALADLRQTGDIDVWITPYDGETTHQHFLRVMAYINEIAPTAKVSRLHAFFDLSDILQYQHNAPTIVELHFTPVKKKSPLAERRLQLWFRSEALRSSFRKNESGLVVPNTDFNIIFLLLHMLKHLLNEGCGLRQIMDYYYVLLHACSDNAPQRSPAQTRTQLKHLGILRFAAAMLWVMQQAFGTDETTMKLLADRLMVEPDAKLGRIILDDIMQRGNFGQGVDEAHRRKGSLHRFLNTTRLSIKYLPYFPSEVIWQPWYRISQRIWMLRNGYISQTKK